MTAQNKIHKIVGGPSALDLAMALVARKLRMSLEITVLVEGERINLQITVQELADNGPSEWIMGGIIESLQKPGYQLRSDLSEMLEDKRENGPFYRAFYSTQDRQGSLAFFKTRMIPYHSAIFNVPNCTPDSREKRHPEDWRSEIGYRIENYRDGWPEEDGYDTWNDPCTLAEFYQRLAECEGVLLLGTGCSRT